jgi:adenosylmethionine-8-amino-7-oxononanoate aminotransferase
MHHPVRSDRWPAESPHLRGAGDITAMSPPLIIEKGQIDQLVETLGRAIKAAA